MKLNVKALVVFCVAWWTAVSAFSRTLAWIGDGHDGLWSNRTNWYIANTPPYPTYALPANGDDLSIGTSGLTTNDLVGLKVGNILVDYDCVISGNSLIVTNGIDAGADSSGTITFNCPLVFPNNQKITADAGDGYYTENTIYLHFNGAIAVTGGTLILQGNGTSYSGGANSHIYLSGPISGSGNIWARQFNLAYTDDPPPNDCSIEFEGANDNTLTGYLRLTTINNSQIVFNKTAGHAVNSRIEVLGGDNANLQMNTANQTGGNSDILVQDGSTLHLNGNDATVGSVTMLNSASDTNSSTLDTGTILLNLNNGAINSSSYANVAPLIKGKLNVISGLEMNVFGNLGPALEIQAAIQGAGFQKIGNATLILNASNSFTGYLDVHEGVLDVRNANALGDTTGETFITGTGSLTLRNLTINGETLIADGYQTVVPGVGGSLLFTVGTCNWNGPISLFTNLVVWADDISLNGPISSTGGLDFLNGTATIGGSSANTYTGSTIAQCTLLQLNKPSGVNAYSGPLVVGDTGLGGPYEARWLNSYQRVQGPLTLYANGIVNLNNHNEDFADVTFNGGEVDTGAGQFAIYQPLTVNASSSTATINGFLGLPAGDSRYFNVSDGTADPDLTINAVVFGSPNYFVKQGAGNLRLANANTFAATTLHEGGTLELGNTTALSGAACVIFDGATLRLNTGGTIANNFEAVGAGTGGLNGAFQVIGANSPTLTGSILLDANTVFNVASTASLGLSGVLNGGSGALTKTGGGAFTLSGGGANTYGGLTTINSGLLFLAKSGGALAVPGNLVLGPAPGASPAAATFLSPNSIGGSSVTINANSSMNLNGHVQTLSQLTLDDGGSAATGAAGTLYLNGGSTVTAGSLNIFGSSAGSSITGNIGLPPNSSALTFTVGAFNPSTITTAPELDVPANIFITSFEDPNFVRTRVNKNGAGRLRFDGNNTYAGSTFVNAGILQVDGAASGGFTVNSATLSGTGSVGPIAMTASASVVSPGHSPGILTCSNFNSSAGNGVFKVELDGTNAGTGYSQLDVNGTVNLRNIRLSATLGFASSTNDQFTIIANDGTDGILSTFAGLPDGSQFYIGGQLFQIHYGPGGFNKLGNDVVLSRLITPPPPPALTIESQPPDSVRLLWPTNTTTYTLRFSIDSSNWYVATPSPIVIGSNNVVTNSTTTDPQKFYRLSSP
jgi:fibronectin-binding autotransporter adhesin